MMPVGHLLLGQGGKECQWKVVANIRALHATPGHPMPPHANHLLH